MTLLQNQNFTLLVVDDEPQNRLLLTEIFQDEHEIILAKNGTQALHKAAEHQPDLILLDVMMPEMDGLTVIRELKRNDLTRHIPVVFITALDSPHDEEQGLLLGAMDYIGKPFHPAVVRARVNNQLQIVHQRRLLEQLAMLDGLTGIPNRRRFDQAYLEEWRRCQRTQRPLSLLLADVDHFKHYNGDCGYAAGDRALQAVARLLSDSLLRPADLVARYGGEEFVLLLPETDAAEAAVVIQRIMEGMRNKQIPHPHSSAATYLSLSLGAISFIPGSAEPDPRYFDAADGALYAAKAAGRNQAHWAAQPRA